MVLRMVRVLPDEYQGVREKPGSKVFTKKGFQCWIVESVLGKEVIMTRGGVGSERMAYGQIN